MTGDELAEARQLLYNLMNSWDYDVQSSNAYWVAEEAIEKWKAEGWNPESADGASHT